MVYRYLRFGDVFDVRYSCYCYILYYTYIHTYTYYILLLYTILFSSVPSFHNPSLLIHSIRVGTYIYSFIFHTILIHTNNLTPHVLRCGGWCLRGIYVLSVWVLFVWCYVRLYSIILYYYIIIIIYYYIIITYYTLISFSSILSSFPHSFYTCRDLHTLTYISSSDLFLPTSTISPRTFYRMGFEVCGVLNIRIRFGCFHPAHFIGWERRMGCQYFICVGIMLVGCLKVVRVCWCGYIIYYYYYYIILLYYYYILDSPLLQIILRPFSIISSQSIYTTPSSPISFLPNHSFYTCRYLYILNYILLHLIHSIP